METPKTYSKPVLSRVDLRPEQTVLAPCVDDTCYELVESQPVWLDAPGS